MPTDDQIEAEIQAKGLTADRVTPDHIEAAIASAFYFTAAEGVLGTIASGRVPAQAVSNAHIPDSMRRLTLCVLVLQNGFTVLGKSAPASASNFDEGLDRKIARQDAVNQMWPLLGYALRERLHLADKA